MYGPPFHSPILIVFMLPRVRVEVANMVVVLLLQGEEIRYLVPAL